MSSFQIKDVNRKAVWNKSNQIQITQSLEWAGFLESVGYETWKKGIFDKSKLVAVCVFYKVNSKWGSYLYAPNGPVLSSSSIDNIYKNQNERGLAMKTEEADCLQVFTDYLKKTAVQADCEFIRIEPQIFYGKKNSQFLNLLGYREAYRSTQPNNKWYIDLRQSKEEILKNAKEKLGNKVRRAAKDGVKVFSSKSVNDFNHFWKIFRKTSKRNKFVPKNKSYYFKQFKILSETDNYKIFWAELNGRVLVSYLVGYFGNVAFLLHGGTLGVPNKFLKQAPRLTIWEIIKDVKAQGYKKFDFYGISGRALEEYLHSSGYIEEVKAKKDDWYGFSKFKMSFGGYGIRFVKTHDLPLSKRYFFIRKIEENRNLLRTPLKFFGKIKNIFN